MADRFARQKLSTEDLVYIDAFKIGTANTANVFPQATRAIYVGVTGNVEVVMVGTLTSNAIVLLQGVPAGTLLPIRAQAIGANTTAATANGLIGFY